MRAYEWVGIPFAGTEVVVHDKLAIEVGNFQFAFQRTERFIRNILFWYITTDMLCTCIKPTYKVVSGVHVVSEVENKQSFVETFSLQKSSRTREI